jgi:hypothetical protein
MCQFCILNQSGAESVQNLLKRHFAAWRNDGNWRVWIGDSEGASVERAMAALQCADYAPVRKALVLISAGTVRLAPALLLGIAIAAGYWEFTKSKGI